MKGRSLLCKYIFSNLTSAASTAISENTGNLFPLWQLGLMFIHTARVGGDGQGTPQITSRVVLLYLCKKTKQKKVEVKKIKKWKWKTVLLGFFDSADFMGQK